MARRSKNGRDSPGKRLSVKRFAGEFVKSGEILVRQRGSRFYAGFGVGVGSDDTLYAKCAGYVVFKTKHGKRIVSVCPSPAI